MEDFHKGMFLGGFFLIFLIIYSIWEEFYKLIVDNYNLLSNYMGLWMPKLLTAIVIIIFANLLIMFANSLLRKYLKYVGKEKEYNSLKSVVKYVVWVLAIIAILSVVMGNFGVWLTSLGLVGFGVTFALQKPILNMVGWFTLIFNRTYSIGDRIKVGDVRGDVKEIQIMYTVMDGLLPNTDELSGKLITVPNEMVLTGSITNFTKTGYYLWDELSIDVTYESNWKKAEKILKEVAFKVVDKYVGTIDDEESAKHKNLRDTLRVLKKHHSEITRTSDKRVIEHRIEQVNKEFEKADEMKKSVQEHKKAEPIVRIELESSSIGLNVRYMAHYKCLRVMKSEINEGFLNVIAKTKDIEIAYPHMQIVRRGKT